MIFLLFGASLAVVVFSEFDVRRVSIEQRQEIAASTLGRIQNLADLVANNDIERASHEIVRLRETFPRWGLLVELEAFLELLNKRPEVGLERIEGLIDSGGDLYLSPVVGAACLLEASNLDGALDLLARIRRRSEHLRHLERMYLAMEVIAGHLSALLATGGPARTAHTQLLTHNMAQTLLGQEIERRHVTTNQLALDLNPAQVQQTKPMMVTLDLWENGGKPSDFGGAPALSLLLGLVLTPVTRKPDIAPLNEYATQCHDAVTLESFGLVALACGEPRSALKHFESAIRLAPAAVRSHWGRAIACYRVGWSDTATASLKRVETLSDDAPLLSVTRRLLAGQAVQMQPADITGAYPRGLSDINRFELALLGVEVDSLEEHGIRATFATRLIRLAAQHSQV